MTALVLAAGGGLRAGEPKLLLRYRGISLIRLAALAVLRSGVDAAVVVLGAEADRLRREITDLPVEIVVHESWQDGLSSSLQRGIAEAGRCNALLVTLADQLLVNASGLKRLVASYRANRPALVVSAYAGVLGVPALFSPELVPELLSLSGDRGARECIDRHRTEAVIVDMAEAATDVDTEEDIVKFGLQRPAATPNDSPRIHEN